MTRLPEELERLAAHAPDVDLTERVVRKARRRRVGLLASALAVAATVTWSRSSWSTALERGEEAVISAPGRRRRPRPRRGGAGRVRLLRLVRRRAEARRDGRLGDRDCLQWRVVTRSGEAFRVPEAMSVYTAQTRSNYANTSAPLEITADGRWIAYYSEKDQRFAVRDLRSSADTTRLAGRPVRDDGRAGRADRPVPGGRFLGVTILTRAPSPALVDVETGRVTDVHGGWHGWTGSAPAAAPSSWCTRTVDRASSPAVRSPRSPARRGTPRVRPAPTGGLRLPCARAGGRGASPTRLPPTHEARHRRRRHGRVRTTHPPARRAEGLLPPERGGLAQRDGDRGLHQRPRRRPASSAPAVESRFSARPCTPSTSTAARSGSWTPIPTGPGPAISPGRGSDAYMMEDADVVRPHVAPDAPDPRQPRHDRASARPAGQADRPGPGGRRG